MLLINAVKDVATALGDLINATKNSSGKSVNDPTMSTLKDSAKVGGAAYPPSPVLASSSTADVTRPFPDAASSYDVYSALCLAGFGHSRNLSVLTQ